jgi:hypothetical protein
MKTKHLFWGMFLISIGFLILLRNYFNFDFQWGDIWKLWPLVLVLFGVYLMISNQVIKNILSVVTAFLLAFTLYASFSTMFGLIRNDLEFDFDDDDYDVSTYSSEFSNNIKTATLDVKAGAGSFLLSDTTDLLFSAIVEGRKSNYSLTSHTDSEEADLLFEMESKKFLLGKNKNRVDLRLNSNPLWDLSFDIGAAAVDFDLTPYNIEKLDIQMGAASLKLKLGSINQESRVYIDAGASSIEIDIPEEVGCEIRAEVSLSSKNFTGFIKESEKVYRTENFSDAPKKILIDLQSGISSIKVNRNSW